MYIETEYTICGVYEIGIHDSNAVRQDILFRCKGRGYRTFVSINYA